MTQLEALRLADMLENNYPLEPEAEEAAAELRRLHEENEQLRQALSQPEQRGHCTCGDPEALGVVHFRTRPCFHYTEPLAQPEQRPVGTYEGVMETMLSLRKGTLEQQQIYTHMKDKLLYTAPPKREWVGLTDENLSVFTTEFYNGAVWAEAKLKEKNGG